MKEFDVLPGVSTNYIVPERDFKRAEQNPDRSAVLPKQLCRLSRLGEKAGTRFIRQVPGLELEIQRNIAMARCTRRNIQCYFAWHLALTAQPD